MTSLLGTVEAALENECNHLDRHFALILMIKHPELFKQKSFFEREITFQCCGFYSNKTSVNFGGSQELSY